VSVVTERDFPESIRNCRETEISFIRGQKEFRRAKQGQKARKIYDTKKKTHETEQKGT